jgi:hypothetical protein
LVEQNVQSSQEYLSAIANSFGGAKIKCTVEKGPTAARLEHVNKGTWVERYNKSAGSWEWFRWDR